MGAPDGPAVSVRRATPSDMDALGGLFAAYLAFYDAERRSADCAAYLRERLDRDESVVLVATATDRTLVGFVQLYPTFSSLDLRRAWRLNDLYVVEAARGRGAGRALMRAAEEAAAAAGAVWIDLETAHDNRTAQALYESEGYERDTEFVHFVKNL